MRVVQVCVVLLASIVGMSRMSIYADFSDTLDKIQPDCTGIHDGTVVLESPDEEGRYWYVMCYNEVLLKNIVGSIWYDAGEDIIHCIDEANYDFDIAREDLIQLVPNCPSYGDILYEYVGDYGTADPLFNGEAYAKTATAIVPNNRKGEDYQSPKEEYVTGTKLVQYIVFAILLLLFGVGIYQVRKE